MSKHWVIVLKIVTKQLTVTEAAQQYDISRRQLQRLLARYRAHGLDAVEPRSRRPKSNARATSPEVVERIIQLRGELTREGSDAGPITIAWHLEREHLHAPSPATIHRILSRAGLVTPEPRKRPRASYVRFEADFPNETWQSDFTHWRLADGTDVEILNWLDDHSRFLIACTAHTPVTGDTVVTTFLAATEDHGIPASTLTDNGSVYTSRYTGGRNAFEYLLRLLGVKQKNGAPGHPTTQGKVERFHQTQKRWLAARPLPHTTRELQLLLDEFREHYNEHRPHRANDRRTPGDTYRATPKALPTGDRDGHFRIRYDKVDKDGKLSLRRAGIMHHVGVGIKHRGKRVFALIDETTVTVVTIGPGDIIAEATIDPDRNYWHYRLNPANRASPKRQMSRDT